MLFISHKSTDKAVAEEVLRRAIQHGYDKKQVFLDSDPGSGIQAGDAWERRLYDTLKHTRAMIVLCSSNWMKSQWCFIELGYARAMSISIFPVLIESCDISGTISDLQAVDITSVDPSVRDAAFARLWNGLEILHHGPKDNLPWPPPGREDDCPFPGLMYFDKADAPVFFGREQERDAIVSRLKEMRTRGVPRFLMVVGSSGSGKSSVLRAGVLPWLGHQTERGEWLVLPTLRYGESPSDDETLLSRLAQIIVELFPAEYPHRPDWKELRNQFESADLELAVRSFVETLQDLSLKLRLVDRSGPEFISSASGSDMGSTALISIDQFEELLNAESGPSAIGFLRFLKALLTRSNGRLLVTATVRSDFLDVYESHAEALTAPFLDLYRLPPFAWERVEEVIVKPAERAGVTIRAELVQRLRADAPNSDALPLLAFTLEKLYRATDGNTRGLSHYTTIGGMEGSIRHTAEQIVPLDASRPEVDAVRTLFLKHLVTVNDNGAFARKIARWSDLESRFHSIIEKFVTHRLLTKTERDGVAYVEVAHEAIFRCWERLSRWLGTVVDVLRWRRDVSASQEVSRSSGRKWQGLTSAQLAIAREWPGKRPDVLTKDEIRWIRRGVFRQWLARGSVASVILLISALCMIAWVLKGRTDHAKQIALSHYLANKAQDLRTSRGSNLNLGMLLAIEGYRRDQSAITAAALRDSLDETPIPVASLKTGGPVQSVQFSKEGQYLAIGGDDGKVRIWDYDAGIESKTLDAGRGVKRIAFSSDGEQLAIVDSDPPVGKRTGASPARTPDKLTIWNWQATDNYSWPVTERILGVYPTPKLKTPWLVLTPEKIEHWDSSGCVDSVRIPISKGGLPIVSGSRSGEWLAIANKTEVQIINTANDQVISTLPKSYEPVTAIAFSLDGAHLAVGRRNGKTDCWNWREKKVEMSHSGYADPIALVFSTDGSLIVEIGLGESVSCSLWLIDNGKDIYTSELAQELSSKIVVKALFTEDSRHLVLCLGDQSVRVLYIPDKETVLLVLYFTTESVINQVALDTTGQILATASDKGWVEVWRLESGKYSSQFVGNNAISSQDGKYLGLSGQQSGIVEVGRNTMIRTFGERHGPMTFSPDSSKFAIAGGDTGNILLFDIRTGQTREWTEGSQVEFLQFSADDDRLFVATTQNNLSARFLTDLHADKLFTTARASEGEMSPNGDFLEKELHGPIHLYDVRRRNEINTIPSTAFDPTVRFSNSGHYFAGRIDDETMVVWETASMKEVMRGETETVTSSIAFDYTERYMAFSDGPRIQVWDIQKKTPLSSLSQEGSDISTIAFSPGRPFLAAGCKDKRIRIWRVPDGELMMALTQEHDFDFGSREIQFTSDGKFLIVTQGFEGGPYGEFTRLVLWQPDDVLRDACRRLVRCRLEKTEWQQYLQGEPFSDTCENCKKQ